MAAAILASSYNARDLHTRNRSIFRFVLAWDHFAVLASSLTRQASAKKLFINQSSDGSRKIPVTVDAYLCFTLLRAVFRFGTTCASAAYISTLHHVVGRHTV